MTGVRMSSVVLAVALLLSFALLAGGVRAHAEYVWLKGESVRLKQTAASRPGARGVPPANVRRAEQIMNACFFGAGAGLLGCMVGAITMGTTPRPQRDRGFDVIQ